MFSLLLPIIYLTFISLGLPDSLLGTAWPAMHVDLAAPVAAQSIISISISVCTIISSLLTMRLAEKLGTGKLSAISVALTAAAMVGFGCSREFWQIWLFAFPYGLGAGAIDSALNNFVALNYGARHMSWLHCCWGVGASLGPVVMGAALAGPSGWPLGYLVIGGVQVTISIVIFLSLPLWKRVGAAADSDSAQLGERREQESADQHAEGGSMGYRELLHLPGAASQIVSFGAYNALECATGLWLASYLVMARSVGESTAATIVSMFYIGITVGRFISGAVASAIDSEGQIRLGQALIAFGIAMLVLAPTGTFTWIATCLMGLGCAPIYPSVVALTPRRFGGAASQGLVSLQMACAYAGASMAPPLFGLIAGAGGAVFIPFALLALLALLFASSERARKAARR